MKNNLLIPKKKKGKFVYINKVNQWIIPGELKMIEVKDLDGKILYSEELG